MKCLRHYVSRKGGWAGREVAPCCRVKTVYLIPKLKIASFIPTYFHTVGDTVLDIKLATGKILMILRTTTSYILNDCANAVRIVMAGWGRLSWVELIVWSSLCEKWRGSFNKYIRTMIWVVSAILNIKYKFNNVTNVNIYGQTLR